MDKFWSISETNFLLEFVRDNISEVNGVKPKSLAELETKMRRKKQNALWEEFVVKFKENFGEDISAQKAVRKWHSLLEGYKKCVNNNNSTGKSRSKFNFYNEMNSLLGERQDIHFLCTASNESGLSVNNVEDVNISCSSACTEISTIVYRPPTPQLSNSGEEFHIPVQLPTPQLSDSSREVHVPLQQPQDSDADASETQPLQSTTSVTTPQSGRRPKRDSINQVLREFNEDSKRMHAEFMEEMKESRQSFLTAMNKLIDKL